ncbi:MAG: hypothetical protein ACTSR8_15615 [Promethearchaeota archaeon]
MISSTKREDYFHLFKSLSKSQIKYHGPLILQMFGTLNKMGLNLENRFILCNFLDQNSDLIDLKEDIYITNNPMSLNRLFIMAFQKAKKYNLIPALYEEYLCSITAISQKEELQL